MPAIRRSQRHSKVVKGDEAKEEDMTARLVSMRSFPYTLPYKRLNLRAEPHLYRPGKGEQGVLMVEPYKSELLPHWKFKDVKSAEASSTELRRRFHAYLNEEDFVGADMARKFIQMGFTRARRYANHKGGRKYEMNGDGSRGRELPRSDEDPVKAQSAQIFKDVLEKVKIDKRYVKLQQAFEAKYEKTPIPRYPDERQPTK